MKLGQALPACLLGLAATQVLACYVVYEPSGRVVYNAMTPPVDMSRPIHETLPARFPGGHLVFDTQADCVPVTPLARASAGGVTPLLTDRRTAQAMKVPYTVLAGGIVLVQGGHARAGQGATIVPAQALAARPGGAVVITELRDPPVTITQSGNQLTIGQAPGR